MASATLEGVEGQFEAVHRQMIRRAILAEAETFRSRAAHLDGNGLGFLAGLATDLAVALEALAEKVKEQVASIDAVHAERTQARFAEARGR